MIEWRERSEYAELYPGKMLDAAYEPHRGLIKRIFDETLVLEARDEAADTINASINRIGTVPTVNIIEMRDFCGDEGYRCAEWAFGTCMHEDWAQRGYTVDLAPDLWRQPMGFLLSHGYRIAQQPTYGDVVAYGGVTKSGIWHEHYAIYGGDDVVISKFGRGPIAEHGLHVISSLWGDRYWLYRRGGR